MTTQSNAERIEGRIAVIGVDTPVARLVPSRHRRTIGAWCFLDHLGPADFAPGEGMNVGPHPHIGLQTFTWMIEGEVRHLDSLGNDIVITPGQVNLMTAGHGISHAEVTPPVTSPRVHASQLWIALPDSHRHMHPQFQNYQDLPIYTQDGFSVTLLVGARDGHTSPVEVYTPLLGLDLYSKDGGTTQLALNPTFEHGIVALQGTVAIDGEVLPHGTLHYQPTGATSVNIQTSADARVLVVGGEPFTEEIIVWWNFVARTHDEIAVARADWVAEAPRFGKVDHPHAGTRLTVPPLEGHLKGAH